MDYMSTLETFANFWMTLSWCSAYQVRAWEILYALVKVRESQKLLMVVKKAPVSLYFDS